MFLLKMLYYAVNEIMRQKFACLKITSSMGKKNNTFLQKFGPTHSTKEFIWET